MNGRKKRSRKRQYKRFFVRFGPKAPEYRAVAIQISPRGLFISTNRPVYTVGSRIVVEIPSPGGSHTVPAIVRHAKRVPPQLVGIDRPGMGVEFVSLPDDLHKYLESLEVSGLDIRHKLE